MNWFSKDLDELDYQFLGLYGIIALTALSIYTKTDIITGFLSAMGIAMCRHLYRSSVKKTKGGDK